ncbi:MAG: RidA family protein [Ruminococcaceae bacterium]|nr:RidA family protein [Oscillospiraceae bacterium]
MKQISTNNAPAAIGPYSQALRAGNMMFVSGQIPVDPASGLMADTIEAQATQSLTNLKNILAAEGLSMKNVIKTTVFLADLADFAKVNAVYETFFEAPYPARSCVQVAAIPKGAGVEIECIAVWDS